MPLLLAALLAAAPRLQLADAKGAVHRLSDYRGKVVLVNFWATWCEPCLEELPSIERLRKAVGRHDLVILAVQMDASARTARDTADKLGLRFPLLLDRDSSVSKAWGVRIVPTTFLFDRSGEVAFRHEGEMDWSAADAQRRVEALLRKAGHVR
jgi:peroxiredoxin